MLGRRCSIGLLLFHGQSCFFCFLFCFLHGIGAFLFYFIFPPWLEPAIVADGNVSDYDYDFNIYEIHAKIKEINLMLLMSFQAEKSESW